MNKQRVKAICISFLCELAYYPANTINALELKQEDITHDEYLIQ